MREFSIVVVSAIIALSGCVQPQTQPAPQTQLQTQPEPQAQSADPAPTREAAPVAATEPSRTAATTGPVPAERAATPATASPAPSAAPAPPREQRSATPPSRAATAGNPGNATAASPPSSAPGNPTTAGGASREAPATAAAPTQAAASPALDLDELVQRLRETNAIGVFTKLSLKNQVDDLLEQFRGLYQGRVQVPLAELRQRYELLLFKVLSLLQDADQSLANAITDSREAIWGILSDPQKFAGI